MKKKSIIVLIDEIKVLKKYQIKGYFYKFFFNTYIHKINIYKFVEKLKSHNKWKKRKKKFIIKFYYLLLWNLIGFNY